MLCVLMKILSHASAKKKTKGLKSFKFRVCIGRFQMTPYNTSVLPSVSTQIARGMFCGVKYTHHTFTPIIKHLITTANKHPGKMSFIDKNMRKSHCH